MSEPSLPKALSVTADGLPDPWIPPRSFRAQVAPDGRTRLVISVPPGELPAVHQRLLQALGGPFGVRYLQLTDRRAGLTHPKPKTWLAMEVPLERLLPALQAREALFYRDARHQTWIKGPYGEQIVLDELGMLYCYPDDPSFRDALEGIPETRELGMDARDYVKVSLLSEADEQERSFLQVLSMVDWKG